MWQNSAPETTCQKARPVVTGVVVIEAEEVGPAGIVVAANVVCVAGVVVTTADAHTLKPLRKTLSSLSHTSSAPCGTCTPRGPDAVCRYCLPATVRKSDPVSMS